MFNPNQNTQITKHAVRLVQSWQARNIFSTLGREAQTLYRAVEAILAYSKPREYTPQEIENFRQGFRQQGFGPAMAMKLALLRVEDRNKQIKDWERSLAA